VGKQGLAQIPMRANFLRAGAKGPIEILAGGRFGRGNENTAVRCLLVRETGKQTARTLEGGGGLSPQSPPSRRLSRRLLF
jgi:hypothetical protein